MEYCELIDSGKVFVNYGPMQMSIYAEAGKHGSNKLAKKGAEKAIEVFTTLCKYQDLAKKNIREINGLKSVPKPLTLMIDAAKKTGDPDVTPMIAVAGSIAQLIAENLIKLGADKVVVNNGGDIALGLSRNESVTVGVMTDLQRNKIDFVKTINAKSVIRGVATSGLGGRSFTLGIASAVTVFAATASQADACATVLCNATSIDDPRVHKVRARDIDPNTDIPELMVTTHVDPLPDSLVIKAMAQAKQLAEKYIQENLIYGALISLQDRHVMIPEEIVTPNK
ncbi:UPF0280 family protein [Thermoanaerobacteraceae bacterium SP2]|nr:UPF0280 family protein [Thermoanaerobacteraceae bacterium SP2]